MRFVYTLFVFVFFLLFIPACKSGKTGLKISKDPSLSSKVVEAKDLRIVSPQNKTYFNPNNALHIRLEKLNDSIHFDSIVVKLEGSTLVKLFDDNLSADIEVGNFSPGAKRLLIKAYSDSKTESHAVSLRLTSDIIPDRYSYNLIASFPHDKGAYTQGLEYWDGFLLEGTGNYGESSLRKVNLETGEIMKFRNLSSEIFGEGITRLNNKIYQISYRSQVGFVYDENSFKLERKIFYQNKEGWGLCNDGKNILMSDGTHVIYFMDTSYFSVERKIEVFDNEKEVNLLNELELIDGILYANRYTTNEIVMIDPTNGKVLGKIDMTGILNKKDKHPRIDYFNGIAYDHVNKRIFVTGKYWPKIYEVEFVKLKDH